MSKTGHSNIAFVSDDGKGWARSWKTDFIDAIIFYDHFSVFVFASCAIQHRPIEWIQTASIYHGWIEWQKQSCQRERQLWSIWESNGWTSNVVSTRIYHRLHRRQIEKNVFFTNLLSFFSNNETLIHLLKGSLGTGILAMPNAFHHSGWVVGSIGTIVIGIICTYCIHMLLRSAYELCKRKKVIFINQNVHFFSLLLRSLSIYLYTSHRRTSSNNSFKYKIRRWSRSSTGLSVGLMKFDAIFSILSFLFDSKKVPSLTYPAILGAAFEEGPYWCRCIAPYIV